MGEPQADPSLYVAVLCAEWCEVCRDFRRVFGDLARDAGASVRFAWIDIEDDEALLGDLDVDDFPTLLVACDGLPRFFGPVRPRADAVAQLLQRVRDRAGAPLADPRLHGLAARLLAHPAGE